MICWDCRKNTIPVSDGAWLCGECYAAAQKRILLPVKPRVRIKRYRDHLSDLPGELEAIDAGMYDTGAEIDDVIRQVEDGSYYDYSRA